MSERRTRTLGAVSWSVVVLYGLAVGGLLAGAEARDVALLLGLAAGLDVGRGALQRRNGDDP